MITKIACVSDLHSYLPVIPECDLLLIPGDLTWAGTTIGEVWWMNGLFSNWAENIGVPICIVGGNHDSCLLPENIHMVTLPSNVHYIQDDYFVTESGVSIYGSPWTKTFNQWHFMMDEADLETHFERTIVNDCDILMTHSPIHGYGDWSVYDKVHTGSPTLLNKIEELKPALSLFGHIHSGHGNWMIGDTLVCNVSLVNEDYKPVNPVTEIEYDGKTMRLHPSR